MLKKWMKVVRLKKGLRGTIIRLVRCSLRCRLLWIPVWPVVLKLKIHEHFSQSIFTVLPWDGVFISTFQLVSDLAGSSDPSYRKAGPNGRGAFNFSFEMVQGRIVAAPFCFLFANISCLPHHGTLEPWPSAGRHLFGLLFGRPQKDGPQPGPLKLAIYSWFSIKNGDFP